MRTWIALVVTFGTLVTLPPSAPAQRSGERERALPAYRMGWDYMRAEAWADAAKAFSDAIDIDAEFELAYYGLGQALMPQKRYVEAVAAYTKCRDLYRAQAGRQFTNQQEAQRYRRDRINELDELIRQVSSGPMTNQMQERLRQLQERRRQMMETITRGNDFTIESSVPGFVSLALGSAYFRSQKFTEAEHEYKAAIAADSKIGEAHNNLAVVYLLTGRPDEAAKELKAAEKAGFKVNPQLKDDVKAAQRKAGT